MRQRQLQELVTQFLHEAAAAPEKKRETVKSDVARSSASGTFDVCQPDPFAARADHRLDELMVGVLVAPRSSARVSGCRRSERSSYSPPKSNGPIGLWPGPNRERRDPRSARGARDCSRVADRRRLRRLQVFADAGPCRRAGRAASACGPEQLGRGRHEDRLLDAQVGQLVEQPRQAAGPIAQPMRLAAPVGVRRKRHRVRLGDDRHGERRRRDRIRQMRRARRPRGRPLRRAAPRRPPCSPAGSDRGAAVRRPARTPDRGAHRDRGRRSAARETPAGRCCPRGDPRTAARDRPAPAACSARRAAQQIPQRRASSAPRPRATTAASRTPRHQNGAALTPARWPRRSVSSPRRARPQPRTSTTRRGSQVGKPPGANSSLRRRTYQPVRPPAPPRPSMRTTKSIGKTTRAGRDRRQRHRPRCATASATAQNARRKRRPPAVEGCARRRDCQKPFSLPQALPAVDGGKQRRRRRRCRGRRRRRA